jgi:hypothetical protein
MKLFAVVALAGAGSACEPAAATTAQPVGAPPARVVEPATRHVDEPALPAPRAAPRVEPIPVVPTHTPAPAHHLSLPGMSAVAPRTLGNGRPACGNVTGRAPQPIDCTPAGKP